MINVSAIAHLLEEAGLGVVSQDIFVEAMPATVTKGLMVRAGIIPNKIDHELPGYYRAKFQVITRAHKRSEAKDLAWAAAKALNFGRKTIGEGEGQMVINYCRPSQLPLTYPASDGNMIEGSINFDISFVGSAF